MAIVKILLAEDNRGDIILIKKAFKTNNILNHLDIVGNGQECIGFLNSNETLPDLIILDINMPIMNGIDCLKIIKKDPKFKKIPVIILTSSEAEIDIVSSYENYASTYLKKPMIIDEFIKLAEELTNYWFTVAKTPKNENGD